MPRYNKKITQLMDYREFKEDITELPMIQQAFLTVLFFCGCRVSEALALTSKDINCQGETVFIQFFRLKGSKQTDPQEVPRDEALSWICQQKGTIFPYTRFGAYRIVKKAFAELYPHFFRMNRITKTDLLFGDMVVYHLFGISANSIDHYRAKVDIKRVGKALIAELSE